jgi:hypothetical protein
MKNQQHNFHCQQQFLVHVKVLLSNNWYLAKTKMFYANNKYGLLTKNWSDFVVIQQGLGKDAKWCFKVL